MAILSSEIPNTEGGVVSSAADELMLEGEESELGR